MTLSSASLPARRAYRSVPLLLLGALLSAFVVAIHVIDQGGPTGFHTPDYCIEPLGLTALAVEGLLLICSLRALAALAA